MAASSPKWVSELRSQLKREHGFGWSVRERNGKAQLTRRWEDGSRSSVMLDIAWNPTCGRAVLNAVAEVRSRMESQNVTLNQAQELACATGTGVDTAEGAMKWASIAEAFLATRADRRATTLRDLKTRVRRALETLESTPKPRDGGELMRRYAAMNFASCPAGKTGRKRQLLDVAALLRFAVERQGAPRRWLPLEGEALEELIGTRDNGAGQELTPPIKPQDLATLLDALEADGKTELWLAVGIVGLFGLRPAELAALRVEDGKLYVGGQVKRNKRTMKTAKPDRLVLPLDILGREGEGNRMLELFTSGVIKLPGPIETAIRTGEFKPVGDAFRQLLDRYPTWQSLAKTNPGLTPYSLRHGFAWRAHKSYDRALSVRDTASLMGHNPSTHHRHYGKWTDEAGLIEAVLSATKSKTLARAEG
jgi:integrase